MMDKYTVGMDITVKEAIEQMTANLIKAVVVLDGDGVVRGLFSNGDMRAFFLRGGSLAAGIREAMNPRPVLFRSRAEVDRERKERFRVIYPIVDEKDRLLDVVDGDELTADRAVHTSEALRDVPLVIMAGGMGTRLHPYTKILPKPLIPIGDVTITERIIDSFRRFGVREVCMVLNYKAGMIRAYMNDLEKDYTVRCVDEDRFLGTGGGLRLLRGTLPGTFFVSNCDTLLDADYECALVTHRARKNTMTVIAAMKDLVIPYGVLETSDDGRIVSMREKPDYSYLINTGVYLLEPEALDAIGEGESIGLPDLAARLMAQGRRVGVFPIPEKAWMDMGHFDNMNQMLRHFGLSEL